MKLLIATVTNTSVFLGKFWTIRNCWKHILYQNQQQYSFLRNISRIKNILWHQFKPINNPLLKLNWFTTWMKKWKDIRFVSRAISKFHKIMSMFYKPKTNWKKEKKKLLRHFKHCWKNKKYKKQKLISKSLPFFPSSIMEFVKIYERDKYFAMKVEKMYRKIKL